MPLEEGDNVLLTGQNGQHDLESNSLLSSTDEEEEDLLAHPGPAVSPPGSAINGRRANRQSSISHPTPDGQRRTPRTTNRVRFVEESPEGGDQLSNGRAHSPDDEL